LNRSNNYQKEYFMPRSRHISKRESRRQQLIHRRRLIGLFLAIALIAVVAIILFSLGGSDVQETQPEAGAAPSLEITMAAAYKKYQEGAFFLDVREPEEWNSFHIPNSVLIPLDDLPNRLNEIPHDSPIVVVCNSGNRSRLGRDTLLQAGFTDVTSMTGGVSAWEKAGYPIEGSLP
jgi:rhodanese-related sulfurtransferase